MDTNDGFTYDEQERLVEKTVVKWNSYTEKWVNYYRLTFVYTDNNCCIEYARWSNKNNCYGEVTEKANYGFDKLNQLTAYQGFKLNEQTNEWNLVQNHEIIISYEDGYRFAQK